MLQLSCKFGELTQNLCRIILLMKSTGIDYDIDEDDDEKKFGPYATPSKIMPHYSYPAGLVN